MDVSSELFDNYSVALYTYFIWTVFYENMVDKSYSLTNQCLEIKKRSWNQVYFDTFVKYAIIVCIYPLFAKDCPHVFLHFYFKNDESIRQILIFSMLSSFFKTNNKLSLELHLKIVFSFISTTNIKWHEIKWNDRVWSTFLMWTFLSFQIIHYSDLELGRARCWIYISSSLLMVKWPKFGEFFFKIHLRLVGSTRVNSYSRVNSIFWMGLASITRESTLFSSWYNQPLECPLIW